MKKKGKLRIMFVDDDKDVLDRMDIIGDEYPKIQFHLHLSQGGALKMLHLLHYLVEAIVIDLNLQDGAGRELTSMIRKREPNYGHEGRIQIYWFTGETVDLDDAIDPITQTYFACRVRKIYQKATDGEIEMVQEIINQIDKR